jgi:hypothetical protein
LFFVIDALDECEGEDSRPLLGAVAKTTCFETIPLRIFITSRPKLGTSDADLFNDIFGDVCRHYNMHEHQGHIKSDISMFIDKELSDIRDSRCKKGDLPDDWPPKEKMGRLKNNCDGLFIYAATASRFLRNSPSGSLDNYLSFILNYNGANDPRQDEGSDSPASYLDDLYTKVLDSAVGRVPAMIKDEEQKIKQILEPVAILRDTLSSVALAELAGKSETEVTNILNRLSVVVDVGHGDSPIQLIHPSFRDYLVNRRRSDSFWINEGQAHKWLLDRCLDLMSHHLKRDIFNLQPPRTLASELDIRTYLSPAIQYACLHWVKHLENSDPQLCDNKRVHQFLREYLLRWLESLGWMQMMSEGIFAINSLESILVSFPSVAIGRS